MQALVPKYGELVILDLAVRVQGIGLRMYRDRFRVDWVWCLSECAVNSSVLRV